jgi:hypothetical protein
MLQAYILIQTEAGKAVGVARQIGGSMVSPRWRQ